jgi:A/G-specific adenine glycosylase
LWSLPELCDGEEATQWCSTKLNLPGALAISWATVRHSFTHFDLDIEPIAVRVDGVSRKVADSEDQIWYELDAPQKLGLAAPVAGLLDKLRS